MKKPALIRTTKMNVASCQIDTAIHLFASGNEEISISTLLLAAWDILWPLLEKAGKSSVRNLVSAEKDWKLLNKFYTYCKHSKEDGDKDFVFPENYVEPLLCLVVIDFKELYPERNSEFMETFWLWYISKLQPKDNNLVQKANKLFPNLHTMSLSEQKSVLLEALYKLPK
jgi:hypothetical protein